MNYIEKKRHGEKEMVRLMIGVYCKAKHKQSLCEDCQKLVDYAFTRIDHCPVIETKTFCSSCKIHCYNEDRREQIRTVMRFSGPRMLWHHPIKAVQHLLIERKEGRKK